MARNGQGTPAGLRLCWGRQAGRWWLHGAGVGMHHDGSERLAHPPCTAGNPQVKLDPKKAGLALVDGACASPSPQGEGKVLWVRGEEMPEQVKHERLTGKGHGEF